MKAALWVAFRCPTRTSGRHMMRFARRHVAGYTTFRCETCGYHFNTSVM